MDSSKKPEKDNPRKSANILSNLLFGWSIPLLYRGAKQGLNVEDLTKCMENDNSEQLGDRLEEQWFDELERANQKGRVPMLRNAIIRTFWRSAIIDGLISLIYITIKTLIPAFLAQLLLQFQLRGGLSVSKQDENINAFNRSQRAIVEQDAVLTNSSDDNLQLFNNITKLQTNLDMNFIEYIWNDVYWLGSIIVLATLIGCFMIHHVDLRQRLMGARMRIACCSLIYRKTLRLSMKTAGSTPAGYLINLLSNDVNRLDYGFIFMHWIWILPFQATLTCYLIWQKIGIASLIGVLGLLIKTIPVQTGLSKLSSKLRMRIAEHTDARVGLMDELVQGIQVIKMYAWEKPFQYIVAEARRREIKQIRYASYLRGFFLSTMVFTERSTLYITVASAVLLGKGISADLVFSCAGYFNIVQLVAAIWYPMAVSFGAEALVSLKRIQKFLLLEAHTTKGHGLTHKTEGSDDHAILLQDIKAGWDLQSPQFTLQNVNLKVPKGKLCAIIGPVGAGKSSLLHLILGELPIASGNVVIQGEVSYGSQEPWLFKGTVRSNILFGESYDRKRYQEVTKSCALATDFQQLSNGDKTVVGDRGSSLSGGQRARISLARAVYKPAQIYLLDDPLSAVDAHVGKHLFDEVIGPHGRLAKEQATRVLVTHQVHFLTEADWIIIVENGRIMHQGSYNDLANSDLDFAKILEHPKQQNTVIEEEGGAFNDDGSFNYDDDIPYIDGMPRTDSFTRLRKISSAASSLKKSMGSDKDISLKDEDVGAEVQVDKGVAGYVWWEYFTAGSSVCGLLFMCMVMLVSQVVCSGSDFFVNIWTQQEYLRSVNQPTLFTTTECLYIYGALIIAVVIMTVFRGFLFFKVCMHASKVLHNRMFGSILHATMRFFNTNPSGRILNRFSRDMGAIDELLPKAMMDFIQISLVMFGILIVIIIVNPILMVAIFVVAVIDYYILKLYLRPSQDLKRMEGICRSPVFSHLSASLTGLATIRARGLQEVVGREFDNLQDVHSAVWQLAMCSNTALGLWLDCVSCVFLSCVTFSFIFMLDETFSGNVGLAISQAMILTGMVQYGVRQVAESIQQMTSTERVLQYTDLEHESEVQKWPSTSWPARGHVEFRNMSLRYDLSGAAILKNLTITIEPSWKVGIVGRTGAGKSSLISALFRLAYIDGDILIDDVETGAISLEALRSKISIIPQDPVLFSATIRYNLDPFEKYSDAQIWSALEHVELKGSIGSLDFKVTERGSNFSVGQRQLLCLARAILRSNKVLVLDEATANVDPQTDALIQRAIRTEFKHCTVLTVAHRLHTVMDSDRILVMDAGYAREYDIPYMLLKNKEGLLRQMVEATGAESDNLRKIALDSYRHMQKSKESDF